MDKSITSKIEEFMKLVKIRNHHEPEFLQAVQEVAETVIPYIINNDIYHGKNILLRMVEPERLLSFRACHLDVICLLSKVSNAYKHGDRFQRQHPGRIGQTREPNAFSYFY